jgi:hypothetical protein
MLHFDTKSSKGIFCYNLITSYIQRSLMMWIEKSQNVTGLCVNIGKSCKAKIRYKVDFIVAGRGQN